MKKLLIPLLFFAVTSCISVQIPKSLQEQMSRIEQKVDTNTKVISQTSTQITEINENYQTILKGIVSIPSDTINYDILTNEQLKLLRAKRGLGKKE